MNRFKLVTVMVLWGSIGVFTRYIQLSPIQLAFVRAVLASLVMVFVTLKEPSSPKCGKSIRWYMVSGALIGLAWVALFYGYKHTTIASAVIIYNMCPVYVMLAAPFLLGEKRTKTQTLIVILSFIGLMMIVGLPGGEGDLFGKMMSGISGLLYAVIVLINRKINHKLSGNKATMIQMLSASVILLPIVLTTDMVNDFMVIGGRELLLVGILGVVHTGVAYSIYFSTYHQMKSIDIVIYSYLEPLFGLVFSVVFLGETLVFIQVVGGSLILGSTFLGQYFSGRYQEKSHQLL